MRPLILFAHGAGAPSSSDWMRAWADRLRTVGDVETFDYPYMHKRLETGRKQPPDPLPVLLAAHRTALRRARRPGQPVVLAGKSMGARVSVHLAAQPDLAEVVCAAVCLGYPLVAPGRRELKPDRVQVLLDLPVPVLFCQGSRDPFCPLDLLQTVRGAMKASSDLVVVEGGDHSLHLSRRALCESRGTQAASDARVLEAIRTFLERVIR